MKILYDCFSCSPYYGSDEGIGWMWPYTMRQYHDIWVLVRNDRRKDIERYCHDYDIDNIHFIYCDIPKWMNIYYKNLKNGKNGIIDFLVYQYMWQFAAYRVARALHKKIVFDLVHHVCTNDFRILGRMYKLKIPFVIGPIGGAQETPLGLHYYTRRHRNNEIIRSILNKFMIWLPGYKKALNLADRIYFSNDETMCFLAPYINNPNKCKLLTEVGYDGEVGLRKENSICDDKTIFMWAGRIEYRKGLELLIDVIKNLPLDKSWEFVLCGDGTDRAYIQQLCDGQLFGERVRFLGKVTYEQVQQLYDKANVFVFPSLRETTGTVIVEAMAHALPVICLNQGGGRLVVSEETGFLINVQSKEECINELTSAIIKCINDPFLVKQKGEKAALRVKEKYLWDVKCREMSLVYEDIIRKE